jgi:hypothetical protein
MSQPRSSSVLNLSIGIALEAAAVLLYTPINNYFYNKGSWPLGPIILAVIYASGIYFIFRSHLRMIFKYILSYWWMAIVIWYATASGIQYIREWRAYRYEAYLIPEGYHGRIEINFGQTDGVQPLVEEDQVVFSLGQDGKLNSRYVRPVTRYFSDAYPRFFYVDSSGNRKPLKRVGEEGIRPEEVFVEFLKNNASHREFLICTQAEHKAYF